MPGSTATADERLLSEAMSGNTRGVESALAAGASVDGSSKLDCAPLMAAVRNGHTSTTKLLIKRGAHLEVGHMPDSACSENEKAFHAGMRAVHLAAIRGDLDVLRLLLQAGANPNSVTDKGCTPLMTCGGEPAKRVAVTRELLRGGADPTLANNLGHLPLHYAACVGHSDVMEVLLSKAPTTLNQAGRKGETPLFLAAEQGEVGAVSHLLSAGASNRAAIATADELGLQEMYKCPLMAAVSKGHEEAVRILLEDGLEALGGLFMVPHAVFRAVDNRRPRVLQRLLVVEGVERQRFWARFYFEGVPFVHHAASYGNPTGVGVLLSAGADEAAFDARGRRARDVIGSFMPDNKRGTLKEAAVHRTLERGPAFRARSWTWPTKRKAGTAVAVGGGGAGAGGGADAVPVLSSSAPRVPLDIQLCRTRNRRHFANLVSRYAQKR